MFHEIYHVLLMAKLHYIEYKNYTDGIHGSKYMLHGYRKKNLIISIKCEDEATKSPF